MIVSFTSPLRSPWRLRGLYVPILGNRDTHPSLLRTFMRIFAIISSARYQIKLLDARSIFVYPQQQTSWHVILHSSVSQGKTMSPFMIAKFFLTFVWLSFCIVLMLANVPDGR